MNNALEGSGIVGTSWVERGWRIKQAILDKLLHSTQCEACDVTAGFRRGDESKEWIQEETAIKVQS